MGRWQPDARARLEQAALELFDEHGYDQATAAGIAARAGLTERTFFRHFPDKREVLFGGAAHLQDVVVAEVAAAPADLAPLDAVAHALAAAGALFEQRRDASLLRARVLAANPALQERELIKLAGLAAALAAVLRDRGVDEPAAGLAGQAGIAVLGLAYRRWVERSADADFAALVQDAVTELRSVTTA